MGNWSWRIISITIPSPPTPKKEGTYAVFFLNMSDLFVFEQNLNQILLIIMVIGLVTIATITYLLVSRITKPLQTLALFAKEIGEGNYQTIDEEFVDLELHELKTTMNETTKNSSCTTQISAHSSRTLPMNCGHRYRSSRQTRKVSRSASSMIKKALSQSRTRPTNWARLLRISFTCRDWKPVQRID